LRLSSPETFFLAVTILDKYLRGKHQQRVVLTSETLYLLGMTVVFLSSKYEDVMPIAMRHLIDDVGHFKFTRTQILALEKDVLSTLGFKIVNLNCHYNEACLRFK
jgi:hypothetical protein